MKKLKLIAKKKINFDYRYYRKLLKFEIFKKIFTIINNEFHPADPQNIQKSEKP